MPLDHCLVHTAVYVQNLTSDPRSAVGQQEDCSLGDIHGLPILPNGTLNIWSAGLPRSLVNTARRSSPPGVTTIPGVMTFTRMFFDANS